MIADLDETLRQLLIAEIPIKNGEIEISFDQPRREWSSRLSRPTVNFFLYDVRENAVLRQHQWERVPPGKNGGDLAHLKRSPYRIDCLYMLTAWAADPEDEHRLLSRCLAALFRFPTLPAAYLAGSLPDQLFEIQARLAAPDRLTNPAEVWSALDNEMRPSISYAITLALDPWREVEEPVVHTLILRSGQAASLPVKHDLLPETGTIDRTYIGGTVRRKSQGNAPQAGVAVSLQGTGLASTTDDLGRFQLGSVLPGNYTLVVLPPEGKRKEKKVRVPASEGNYDLEID